MSTQKLAPTPVSDTQVLEQCRQTINKWSNALPFAIVRNMGDAIEFVSATQYHAYSFNVDTRFVTRKFEEQKGGDPVSSPADIKSYDLWTVKGAEDEGDYDFPIKETCYKVTCETCEGQGRMTCGDCHGERKVTCSKCDGSGEMKCGNCHGYGELRCDKCAGGGAVDSLFKMTSMNTRDGEVRIGNSDRWQSCPRCHGSARLKCDKCHGTGKKTCSKCKGRGEVTCDTCDGTGIVTCGDCEGRGWNSFMWHLIQEESDDSLEEMFHDEGVPEEVKRKTCEKYVSRKIFAEIAKSAQVDRAGIDADCAPFAADLHAKWDETHAKFVGHDDQRVLDQKVEFVQYDSFIRYEYVYEGKTYHFWIDIAHERVFEGAEGGLMSEWSAQVAAEGDKLAAENPQGAIRIYAKSCAISDQNEEPAKKIRNLLNAGSWWFRLATAAVGGTLWAIFLGCRGANPLLGYLLAAFVVGVDWLFANKRFWVTVIAAVATVGISGILFPPADASGETMHLLPLEMEKDVMLMQFVTLSVCVWVGAILLCARDLTLRMKGWRNLHLALGAFAGFVCAPAAYLDYAENPQSVVVTMCVIAFFVCGLAAIRSVSRAFVQNCGRNAQKFPKKLIKFEVESIRPMRWPVPACAAILALVCLTWLFAVGPFTTGTRKARAAATRTLREYVVDRGLSEAFKTDARAKLVALSPDEQTKTVALLERMTKDGKAE